MKHLMIVMISLLLAFHAEAQNLRSASGSKICTLEKTVIRNSSGRKIGVMEARGTIRNEQGRKIGTYDDGDFRSASGRLLYRLDDSGRLRNSSGKTVYVLYDNGDVRLANLRKIAKGDGLNFNQIAMLLVYFYSDLE